MQALAIRDARLKQVRIIAEQFAAEIDVTDAGFSTALDTVAQAKRIQEMQAERTARPGIVVPFDNGSIPQLIVARTTVRVRGLPLVKVAAFIDAMSAAGVDDLPNMLNNAGSVTTLLMLRTLGLSPIPSTTSTRRRSAKRTRTPWLPHAAKRRTSPRRPVVRSGR